MPLRFWNDPGGERLRAPYFDVFPGVWRHGDWITVTEHGSVVIHGRSDATLNRRGVRMGSSDIYGPVEDVPEVVEALVIGLEEPDGGYWMPMFLTLADGVELDDELRTRIVTAIRTGAWLMSIVFVAASRLLYDLTALEGLYEELEVAAK